jgi:hypothetical protein
LAWLIRGPETERPYLKHGRTGRGKQRKTQSTSDSVVESFRRTARF